MPLDKFGIERETPSDMVRDLVSEGKMISAIKDYREQNPGLRLKEAMNAVEAIRLEVEAARLRGQSPDQGKEFTVDPLNEEGTNTWRTQFGSE